ncbi:RluA family pseudouridine synthase [Candidatus Woesebacteria bacterium]|jgi:23S rRNA pseudouridine1911/1915/1917 synthase|nr:RluA family pseudouridine synthase [Candidatus Woesebacteria bacterium]
MIDLPILFEDESLVVVNKPPGIVVNRAESVQVPTVQEWAEEYLHIPAPPKRLTPALEQDPSVFFDRAGIVHRIDKETSGCLLIAKNPDVFLALQAQFKERTIKKTYLALAHGMITPEIGEIVAPVGRLPWNRERFGIVPGGKDSVTKYKCMQILEHKTGKNVEKISLVELYPETGRTHQIRVHLKYINHPIIGDFQYAGRKTSRADRVWAPRVMLHAWKVDFLHPVSLKRLAIEAPIPDDMNGIVQTNNSISSI